ncbi:cache domain-containing protein [bacterium]|nr:cache domain-containing protein [bacterium]
MRISKKINLGFTVVILLAVITTLYSINSYKNLTYKSIGDSSLLLAKKIINSIDKNIHYRIEEIQFMSTSPIVQTVLEESNEYFESIENPLEYIFELNKNWVSAVVNVYTPFMENIINNRLSRILQKRQRFYSRKYGYEVFAEMFVTNRFGANVSQTGRTFDYYQADEEWWIFAKRNGINISDAEYDRSAGIYSVDISVRIDDEPGNFLGVMKTVLNIKDIFEVIHKVEVDSEQESKSIEFLLLGSNGKVIYSKERFKYNEDISNLFQIEKKVIKNSN